MHTLTGQGEQAVADLATRYGVSVEAVRALLAAVRLGGGTMAQFSHPELGGSGQWMAGGMTMVGDLVDNRLRALVSGLAGELAALLAATPVYVPTPADPAAGDTGLTAAAALGAWWPAELGEPGSSGGQNDTRYAVFPPRHRLALRSGAGPVRVYDTLDHTIGGVHQQQGGRQGTLTFTSQHGTFTVETLPLVPSAGATPAAPAEPAGPPVPAAAPATAASAPSAPRPPAAPPTQLMAGADADAVLATLDRLGELHDRGVLTDEEFAAKKAELLARL